jgi:hypothetical protein
MNFTQKMKAILTELRTPPSTSALPAARRRRTLQVSRKRHLLSVQPSRPQGITPDIFAPKKEVVFAIQFITVSEMWSV